MSIVMLATLVGILLEIVGIVIAAVGLGDTWREIHPAGGKLRTETWIAFKALVRRTLRYLQRQFNRLVLRQAPQTVSGAGSINAEAAAFDATVSVSFDPLPSDTDEAVRALKGYVDHLKLENDKRVSEIGSLQKAVTSLETRIADVHEQLDLQDREFAVGGIPTAIAGLMVTVGGLILQLVAAALLR